MRITFDQAKRDTTLKELGLDFADAGPVFASEHTVLQSDRHSEPRFISAGFLRGRMVGSYGRRAEARSM